MTKLANLPKDLVENISNWLTKRGKGETFFIWIALYFVAYIQEILWRKCIVDN